MKLRFVLFLVLSSLHSMALGDFVSPAVFEKDTSRWKALVFLSEACPCSRSHIEHLNELGKKYPELKIYGVISEPPRNEEERARTDSYFKESQFQFPVISDQKQSLVKKYGALKTPHLTLFEKNKADYVVLYEGGVTNQKDFEKSTIKYFEENMKLISQGQSPRYKNGQSLGCYIRRI